MGSGPPTRASPLNGASGVTFDANNEYVSRALPAWGTSGEAFCFAVFRKRVSQSSNYAFFIGHGAFPNAGQTGYLVDDDSTGGPAWYASGYPSAVYWEKLDPPGYWGVAPALAAAQLGATHLLRRNGTATTFSASGAGAVPNYSARTWYFGAGGAADTTFMDGDLFQLVLLDYAPTMDEVERLEGWAAWKYGLQANLPSGHSYKTAAPTIGGAGHVLSGAAAGAGAAAVAAAAARPLAAVAAGSAVAAFAIDARRPVGGSAVGSGKADGDLAAGPGAVGGLAIGGAVAVGEMLKRGTLLGAAGGQGLSRLTMGGGSLWLPAADSGANWTVLGAAPAAWASHDAALGAWS
ncbi:MAG: hypothetical protein ACK4YQ_08270 [Phenylobacterium sp.]|uniref:hypothetical protein n=1 Tax=Phenylobacterium sp. TaxID=1871053 RepID=UPI00391B39F2